MDKNGGFGREGLEKKFLFAMRRGGVPRASHLKASPGPLRSNGLMSVRERSGVWPRVKLRDRHAPPHR
jgi:hypothetical protein